jgi:hypothetical protein
LANTNENTLCLLDVSILSRYKFEKYKTKKEEDKIFVFTN